jgi:hypothetical protein
MRQGDGVEAPVDEHAEACLAPPLHAGVALGWGFGVLSSWARLQDAAAKRRAMARVDRFRELVGGEFMARE